MIENLERSVGENLFIKFSSLDKVEGLRVFVEVIDQENAVVFPRFELPEIRDRFFQERTLLMPARPQIVALFYTTLADGITDAGLGFLHDTYDLRVVGGGDSSAPSDELIGIIENESLVGSIQTLENELIGVLDESCSGHEKN